MAEKRALVAAVLIGTALSDLFTQDIEDMPYLVNGKDQSQEAPARPASKPAAARHDDGIRMATEKQVRFIRGQIKKKGIADDAFFEAWGHFEAWDDIPFDVVNNILEWIREQ
jgi:hypothetical protein